MADADREVVELEYIEGADDKRYGLQYKIIL